jgi:hypothetical protein
VSPVKYELGFYIPEDDILHSYHRENLKSYIHDTGVCSAVLMSLPPNDAYPADKECPYYEGMHTYWCRDIRET